MDKFLIHTLIDSLRKNLKWKVENHNKSIKVIKSIKEFIISKLPKNKSSDKMTSMLLSNF